MSTELKPGDRFGKLTAVALSPKRGKGVGVHWEFVCDCGKRVTRRASQVSKVLNPSCGCAGRYGKRKRDALMTQQEVANKLGLSRGQVWYAESRGLKKLAAAYASKGEFCEEKVHLGDD